MIDLFLIRHAECEINTKPDICGGRSTSSPLTDVGRKQASYLMRDFNSVGFGVGSTDGLDEVVTSNAVRTIETARMALSSMTKGPWREFGAFEELAELDQGDWEGEVRAECYTEAIMEEIQKCEGHFKAPNGESQKEVSERMEKWINKNVVEKYSDTNAKVAIVSHGIAIKCFLQAIMGFTQDFVFYTHLHNCSITRLHYDKRWIVKSIGSTGISGYLH